MRAVDALIHTPYSHAPTLNIVMIVLDSKASNLSWSWRARFCAPFPPSKPNQILQEHIDRVGLTETLASFRSSPTGHHGDVHGEKKIPSHLAGQGRQTSLGTRALPARQFVQSLMVVARRARRLVSELPQTHPKYKCSLAPG